MGRPDAEARLFVFGSLLDPTLRAQLLGRAVATLPAILRDYERRRAQYFYVARRSGNAVSGLVLLELTPRDFAVLDQYEEAPRLYTRELVGVDREGQSLGCWIYLPTLVMLAPNPD